MKKLLIVVLCVWLGLPACARKFQKIPFLSVDAKVQRQVAQSAQQLTWQGQLLRLRRSFLRLGRPQITLPPVYTRSYEVEGPQKQIYFSRLFQVQQSVSRNPALAGFTFVAPVPEDLARLSDANYETLHAFLKNRPLTRVKTKPVRPFTLSVQIVGTRSALELWMEVPSQKIILMSDNMYSTAQAKYGLHVF